MQGDTLLDLGQVLAWRGKSDGARAAFEASIDRYRAPDPETLVRNTVQYLVNTKWGREV